MNNNGAPVSHSKNGDGGGLSLQRARLSEVYRVRLDRAGAFFCSWCLQAGAQLHTVVRDEHQINQVLVNFIQHVYDLKLAQWWALHALLWVQTEFRWLKGHLRSAWDSIASWRLLSPVRSRTPLPEPVLKAYVLFAVMAALKLETSSRDLWWRFAVLVQFGFHGLFRPAELLALR